MSPRLPSGNSGSKIRIWVAHEDPVVGEGVASICAQQADFAVRVGAAGKPAGDPSYAANSWDIVVVEFSDIAAWLAAPTRQRTAALGAPRIIVVGPLEREWQVRSALESGAHGYVHQGCDPEELWLAVRTVAKGGRYVTQLAAQCVANGLNNEALTPRELEVLALLGQGLANKSIAQLLHVAPGTVKTHVAAILDKLNASTRTEAVATALHRGLVQEPAHPATKAPHCP
ncbi:response regulator transcription factor [uncultured Ramlibacter sp.]|uniref:response regulator transcription factor n=1 Tax=uncultured Ramlibacter sp. TaxID=260755 RepID=UPI00262107F2|nr:response regulator transcription factor [uncultured Ramlibacter sp.]